MQLQSDFDWAYSHLNWTELDIQGGSLTWLVVENGCYLGLSTGATT